MKKRTMSEAHKKAISDAKMGHKVSRETKLKIGVANTGKIRSLKFRKMISKRMTGLLEEKGRHWLGDKIGRVGIHLWLRRVYGRPIFCEFCKSTDKNKSYDWASVDHKYVRDRKAFMRLCRSCHRKYDFQHNNYKASKNKDLLSNQE